MIDPRWYVGPWIWDTSGVMPCWMPPVGTVGCLDMRAIPQMSTAGGAPQGQGVFLSDGPIKDSNYTLLGAGSYRDVKTSQALRDRMPKRDRKREPTGDDLLSHLLDCLTDGSDSTGDSFAKPLMPDAQMRVRLTIGEFDYQWKTAPWNYHWDKIQDVERADFQRCFDDAQAGRLKDKDHHRRVLDALCEKYGADDWRTFVNTKIRKHIPGRLKHETTIADDFNRADQSGLGTSASGFSWTLVLGSINIVSGRAQTPNRANDITSVFHKARAESDLSSADHYCQCNVYDIGGGDWGGGALARFNSGAETCYFGYQRVSGSTSFLLAKVVAGSLTVLSSTGSGFPASGDLQKLVCSGSTITLFNAGVSKLSATDSAITGNLRAGVCSRGGGTGAKYGEVDNFEAGDNVASGTNYTQLERNVRGLNRGVYTHYEG